MNVKDVYKKIRETIVFAQIVTILQRIVQEKTLIETNNEIKALKTISLLR